jgi:ABC-type Fe3+-citrate transport system substrate-binding protein
MKTIITLALFLCCIFISACGASKKNSNNTTIVEKKEPEEKLKGDSDIVKISPLGKTDYKIKVGQKISYSYKEHGSVLSTT